MNKLALLVFILLIPFISISQKTFAPLGASWKYEKHTLDPCLNHFFEVRAEKEIDVNGKDCTILYGYSTFGSGDLTKEQDSLVIWEESNKIYFEQDGEFYLMYDFNFPVGDTLTLYSPSQRGVFSHQYLEQTIEPISSQFIIESVGQIVIDNDTLKRARYLSIDIADYELFNVIEKVGTTAESIIGGLYCVADGCGCFLICKSDDNFSYPKEEVCEFPTSIASTDNLELEIYPNPTTGVLFIEGMAVDHIGIVSDVLGRKIFDVPLYQSIDMTHLQYGIYYLSIYRNNKLLATKKLIKQ